LRTRSPRQTLLPQARVKANKTPLHRIPSQASSSRDRRGKVNLRPPKAISNPTRRPTGIRAIKRGKARKSKIRKASPAASKLKPVPNQAKASLTLKSNQSKGKGKDRVKAKAKARVRHRVKRRARGRSKPRRRNPGKGRGKVKARDKARVRVRAKVRVNLKTRLRPKVRVRDKAKDRAKGKGKDKADPKATTRSSQAPQLLPRQTPASLVARANEAAVAGQVCRISSGATSVAEKAAVSPSVTGH
jgi:hypothetical protein